MKCPKCSYLGFETGDRCRNCGYDFSLLMPVDVRPREEPPVDLDLPLRFDTSDRDPGFQPGGDLRLHRVEDVPLEPVPAGRPLPRSDAAVAPARGGARETPRPPAPAAAPSVASLPAGSAASLSMTFPVPPVPASNRMPVSSASLADATSSRPPLPLFGRDDLDAPLVSLPSAPRPPLAVRRTPVPPARPRPPAPVAPRVPDHPARDRFPELSADPETPSVDPPMAPVGPAPTSPPASSAGGGTTRRVPPAAGHLPIPQPSAVLPSFNPVVSSRPAVPSRPAATETTAAEGAGAGRSLRGARFLAGVIDHGILLGVDVVVVYFTLRLTNLAPDAWRTLPLAPLAAFLIFVKLAYLGTFTVVGGQSIGKMAARLRVVTDDRKPVPFGRGLWRSAAALASALPLGLGLAPILLDGDGRAFHDRVTGTRVVPVPRT